MGGTAGACPTRSSLRANQIEVHPYFTQPEALAADREHGILSQAWAPIGGITFYREGPHTSTLENPVIGDIASAHGKTPAQVMLRWHIQQGRQVIPKSVTPARIAEDFDVFEFDLTAEQAPGPPQSHEGNDTTSKTRPLVEHGPKVVKRWRRWR